MNLHSQLLLGRILKKEDKAMHLSKSKYCSGVQCPKMLWLDKHRPGLRVIPPEIQARLDAVNDFGDRAMGMFGPYE